MEAGRGLAFIFKQENDFIIKEKKYIPYLGNVGQFYKMIIG